MPTPKLDRRAVLKGLAGVSLALPVLEAMGKEVAAMWAAAKVDEIQDE